MTNDDIRKKKINYYVSLLEESYYGSSYLPKILNPYFSKNVPLEKELTTKASIPESELQSNTKHPEPEISKKGVKLAEQEIDYLLTEVRKRNKIQSLPEELPEKPNLLSNIFEFNKQNFLIVPIKLFTYMFQNNDKWGYRPNKETGEAVTMLVEPPAIIIPSKSITDVICIINSSYGMVDYHSKDDKDKRLIVHVEDTGFGAKITGVLWLKIDLSSKADNALFKIPDALLEIIET